MSNEFNECRNVKAELISDLMFYLGLVVFGIIAFSIMLYGKRIEERLLNSVKPATGTFVRRDETYVSNSMIVDVHRQLELWLKRRGFKIKVNYPLEIVAVQRWSGDSSDIDHWYKDLRVTLSEADSGVHVALYWYSPWVMSESKLDEARNSWKEYSENMFRFMRKDGE